MNRHIHDKLQVSTVTDKQASADKLLDYSTNQKNFVGPMFHTKFDEKSWNFKFIASTAKTHRPKNQQGRGGRGGGGGGCTISQLQITT